MKKTITETITELKQAAEYLNTIVEVTQIATRLEKAEPKGKEVESEEGGTEGKVKKPKVLDAEEQSLKAKRKDDITPGARQIVHAKQDLGDEITPEEDKKDKMNSSESKMVKEEKKATSEEARKVFDKYNASHQAEEEKTLREKQAKERAEKEVKKDEMMKDDQPHPPGSPDDKAHDVIEEHEPLQQALQVLPLAAMKEQFFAHLRSAQNNPDFQRSPANEAAGMEKAAAPMQKPDAAPATTPPSPQGQPTIPPKGSQIPVKRISTSSFNKLKDAGYKPVFKSYDEAKDIFVEALQKSFAQKRVRSNPAPSQSGPTPRSRERGVHTAHWVQRPGESTVGMQVREKASMMLDPKERHQNKLTELKTMKTPNLPKSELDKAKMDEGKSSREKIKAREARENAKPIPKIPLKPHVESFNAIREAKNKVPHTVSTESDLDRAARSAKISSHVAQERNISKERKLPKPNLPKAELEKAKIFDMKGNMTADTGPGDNSPPRAQIAHKLHTHEGPVKETAYIAPTQSAKDQHMFDSWQKGKSSAAINGKPKKPAAAAQETRHPWMRNQPIAAPKTKKSPFAGRKKKVS